VAGKIAVNLLCVTSSRLFRSAWKFLFLEAISGKWQLSDA